MHQTASYEFTWKVKRQTVSDIRNLLISYFYFGLFSLAIAVLLWSLASDASFKSYLLTAMLIGFSVNTAFTLLQPLLERYLPPYIAPIPSTVLGLGIGMLLAGLVRDDPTFFFLRTSLVAPLFFGVLGAVLFWTRERMNTIRTRLAQTEALKLAEEKQHVETRLRLLQAQIEPHFLFNTLSNIAGMIETKPKEAETTLINLTTLLRSSLKRTRKEIVTLADELEIVRAYLEIQRTRMQDRLQYQINLEPTLQSLPLPPLLLQPLVENAIKHGIDPLESGGDITVDISRNGSGVQITVADTGHGIDPTGATAGEGAGLKNIRDRLTALYAGEASLLITDNKPQGIIATLTLPISDDDNSTAG